MNVHRTSVLGLEWPTILVGTALFTAGLLVRGFLSSAGHPHIIESPLAQLLLKLSEEEKSNLPYPPDALPGARDVASPYGSVRVYEWGSETGRKVLLVHGISTPCLALGPLAHILVENGCRVMLFDLFGRGYSDTTSDIPQDTRLFTTQILLVLASSPLAWTGQASGGFAIVGYSLGGGIAAAFTSYFPNLVNSLVLIAPSGLIRPHNFGRVNKILYSKGVIPEPILHRLIRQRLQRPLAPTPKKDSIPKESGILAPVQAEMDAEAQTAVVISKSHPNISIEAAVNHQVIHHAGFVHAFMSSIRNGPITKQHQYWRKIGARLAIQNDGAEKDSQLAMIQGQVLVIGGAHDPLIKKAELEPDATDVFDGNVVFRFINAGHEAPVMNSEEVAQHILDFWA